MTGLQQPHSSPLQMQPHSRVAWRLTVPLMMSFTSCYPHPFRTSCYPASQHKCGRLVSASELCVSERSHPPKRGRCEHPSATVRILDAGLHLMEGALAPAEVWVVEPLSQRCSATCVALVQQRFAPLLRGSQWYYELHKDEWNQVCL
jgi:hypothetical protein